MIYKYDALILANGDPPSRSLLKKLKRHAAHFVCADGGANTAARLNLKPDIVIGDFDSITPKTRKRFRAIHFERIEDQNTTDLEKVIIWSVGCGYTRIVITGAAGKRIDHTVGNLGVLYKFSKRAELTMIDDSGEIFYVGKKKTIAATVGGTISLIPLTRCSGITTTGLQYPLKNESLRLGVRESTSNVAIKKRVTVSVKHGTLLLFVGRHKLIY
jgi:thiamine pyrophosphokinase